MSNINEETINIKPQLRKTIIFEKKFKINKYKIILYSLAFITILINIIIPIIVPIKYKNQIFITSSFKQTIFKLINDSYNKIAYLEKEIIKINEQKDKLIFSQEINDKYIKEQNYFCYNPNIFYNKSIEDKIKLIDINFKEIKFNMFVYQKFDIVSNYIIRHKSWEKAHTSKMIEALKYYSNKKNIRKEEIYIIDIGSNIGWYSFILGKYGYKIIAFEPSKINNYILKKNYCLNKELNLTIINKGLYNEEKKCNIYHRIKNEGNGYINCEQKQNLTNNFIKTGDIILTKFSNYLHFFNDKNLVLIKIDAEGSEGKIFESGIELITKYHVPFIFLEFTPSLLKRHDTDPNQFLHLFADNGYKFSTSDFFNNHIPIEEILAKVNIQINLYLVYSKLLD